ncbi:hypothetical protein SUGI_0534690 [Cryptomeria japonica]|nr:hypothetical protein SUGI_0534690 [Cryptomeria japonica]
MSNGIQIAVKKLSVQSLQGMEQFLNEVKLIEKIQHHYLVNLLGCCIEGSERLLVYEFLPNKSLEKILFHPQRSKELDWHKRLNIIHGVARGLLYLHEDSQLPIIHRDIKASNILLDEKMEPKISDFGLARLFCRDETHINTLRVAGTLGYMAPENCMWEKECNNRLPFEFQTLLKWVWRSYKGENIVDVIDREIIESFSREQVCIHVGLLCTQENASLRPPMSNVYAMLSNHFVTNLPEPTNPSYLCDRQINIPSHIPPTLYTAHLIYPSINDTSISNLDPR